MKSQKNGDSVFRYPLPTQVVDALKTLPRRSHAVFSVTKGKPLSVSTPNKVLTRCGLDATVHGFRSSLTGWAANNGCPKDIQEALMAHKESALRQAYMRDDLLDVRRRWAPAVGGLPADAAQAEAEAGDAGSVHLEPLERRTHLSRIVTTGVKAALLQRWADYLTAPITPLKLFKDEA